MAKVIMFPDKKRLPRGVENDIRKIAREYIEVLAATMILYDLTNDGPTQEELRQMVEEAFAEGICEAIDDLIES